MIFERVPPPNKRRIWNTKNLKSTAELNWVNMIRVGDFSSQLTVSVILWQFAISESPGLISWKIMSPIYQVVELILCRFVLLYFVFFFASAVIINGGLWQALHRARFIPDNFDMTSFPESSWHQNQGLSQNAKLRHSRASVTICPLKFGDCAKIVSQHKNFRCVEFKCCLELSFTFSHLWITWISMMK